jgi:hypothetical protein
VGIFFFSFGSQRKEIKEKTADTLVGYGVGFFGGGGRFLGALGFWLVVSTLLTG